MNDKKQKQEIEPKELALFCRNVMDAGKAENIIQLHVSELSVLADYFILATANSLPHIKAVAARLKKETSKKYGSKPRIDGDAESMWIVLDFGNVVVHILSPDMREQYQLETLWGDAPSEKHIAALAEITAERTR